MDGTPRLPALLDEIAELTPQIRKLLVKNARIAPVGSETIARRLGVAIKCRHAPAARWRVEGALPGQALARRASATAHGSAALLQDAVGAFLANAIATLSWAAAE